MSRRNGFFKEEKNGKDGLNEEVWIGSQLGTSEDEVSCTKAKHQSSMSSQTKKQELRELLRGSSQHLLWNMLLWLQEDLSDEEKSDEDATKSDSGA